MESLGHCVWAAGSRLEIQNKAAVDIAKTTVLHCSKQSLAIAKHAIASSQDNQDCGKPKEQQKQSAHPLASQLLQR